MKNIRVCILLLLLPHCTIAQLTAPKNIIIMVGDGMGYNHVTATRYYLGRPLVFEEFPVKTAMSTYPAKAGEYDEDNPGSNYIATGYNPSLAWKDTAYLKKDFTESAAAATALATGIKTYNNAIGMSVDYDTLENLTELAKSTGRSCGVVTSVPFFHATPAGFVTHHIVRTGYTPIATSMILDSRCDVIMGCGNPAFDNDGLPSESWKKAKYPVDSIFWSELISGKTIFNIHGKKKTFRDADLNGTPDPWTVIRKKDQFLKLMTGNTPSRVLGCAESGGTLQAGRKMQNGETKDSPPYVTPFVATVPSLTEMTAGALNVLDNNREGFFLMVEGGAVDWAAHDNHKGRMIEEMIGFEDAVREVIRWVEKNSSWEETLVIVTGDHETGLLWGDVPFSPVKDNGKGNLPGINYFSTDHTNSLIAVYARGIGSPLLVRFADEYDPVRGYFIQNTEIAQLVRLLLDRETIRP